MKTKPVAIIMGSQSDARVMKKALPVLKEFGLQYHWEIVSAHRTPEKMFEFAKSADQFFSVILAGAGGAAHLPGMVAALTTLPVIGVPIEIGSLKGLDALLSIAQMPKGVPVATMAVDNSENAALLAVRILSLNNPKLKTQLEKHQKRQKIKVREMNRSEKLLKR